MEKNNWKQKWQASYEKASFYKSEQNTIKYWDEVALSGSDGLSGMSHITIIRDYLLKHNMLNDTKNILDVGCGNGDYIIQLASKCKSASVIDYSPNMLEMCKKRCEENNLTNIVYCLEDIAKLTCDHKYNLVFACLNPACYCPEIFDKLIRIAKEYLIYFSMDTSIDSGQNEPIYCGTNSVQYPENYLNDLGISYDKIPYLYELHSRNNIIKIPFAYLVIDVNSVGWP